MSYSANLRGDDAQASSPTHSKITTDAREITALATQLADAISYEESPKRATSPRRLADLKQRIEASSYAISNQQLADAILDRHRLTWEAV